MKKEERIMGSYNHTVRQSPYRFTMRSASRAEWDTVEGSDVVLEPCFGLRVSPPRYRLSQAKQPTGMSLFSYLEYSSAFEMVR